MSGQFQDFRAPARAQVTELLEAIAAAETIIVATIERECEALRTGRMLAAEALHLRLCDAARLYLHATRGARASLGAIEPILPGSGHLFESRRTAFADVLRVELAVLAAERAAAAPKPVRPAAAPSRSRSTDFGGGRVREQDRPAQPVLRVVAGRQEDLRTKGRTPRWNTR